MRLIDAYALRDNLLAHFPQMCATDAQLLRLHHYETRYGIFNHNNTVDKDDPLGLIRKRPGEITNGLLLERIDEYEDRKIKDRFGYTLDQFLALPRQIVNHLCYKTKLKQAEGVEQQESALREVQEILGNPRVDP